MNSELSALTAKTLALFKDATTAGITHGTGLLYYDLEDQAKRLYPVLTPLRNQTARVSKSGRAGDAAHWKTITGINVLDGNNSNSPVFVGVSEGNRNAVMSLTEVDKLATYQGIGIENSVTFEAQYGSEGFDDARALAQITGLEALMIGEESMLLGGNSSLALGQVTGVALAQVTTSVTGIGASVNNQIYCVALTPLGVAMATATGVVPTMTRTNADGSTDTIKCGVGQISAASASATTDATHTQLTGTCNAVKGAAGYAWYFTQTPSAATAYFVAITSIPTITLTANPVNTNQAANATGLSSDNSKTALSFDGYVTQALNGGGYYASLGGAAMTSDGHGGIVELDTMLKYFWNTYKIWIDEVWGSANRIKKMSDLILSGTSNPVYNIIQTSGEGQGSLTGHALVRDYLNPYSMDGAKPLRLRVHPNIPDGWLFANLTHVPYPNANIPGVARVATRQEYYAKEWPLVTRKYQYGVYADEVLQVYVPFGMGLIQDIN